MKDYPEILKNIEFFQDFSVEEIDRLVECGAWVKADPGERIITEGEDDLFLYVLVKGQVSVIKNGKVLANLQSGDSFGEIGALARTPRTAHVVARDQCYCLRFDPNQISKMEVELQLKFVKQILYAMAARLTSLNRRVALL
jgi:CRP-like cAMP-binding protein